MPRKKVPELPTPEVDEPEDDFNRRLWEEGRATGKTEGRTEMRVQVLTFLEKKYINRGVPQDDPYAQAILDLARELSKEMKI